MATALIIITQGDANTNPGSRDDLVTGSAVTLSNQNDAGVSYWHYELYSQPAGSTATLSTPNSPSASFTPDVVGTYLIRLTVNNLSKSSQVGAAVKTPNAHFRIPAANEQTEFNTIAVPPSTSEDGWATALEDALLKLDDGYGGGGGGAVSSVSNSNGSLTISPTTGAVVASLNTAHANTFTAKQTFSAHIGVDGYTVDLSTGAVAGDVVAFNGTSFVPSTNVTGPDIYWTYPAAWSTIKPQIESRTGAGQVANVYLQDNFTNSTFIIDSAFDPSLVTFTGMNFTAEAINTIQINTAPSHMVMNFKNCEVNVNTTISTAGQHLELSLDNAYLVSLTTAPATAFNLLTPGDGYAHVIECSNGGGIFSSNIGQLHDGGILHIETDFGGVIEAIGPDYIITLALGSSSANAYFHQNITGFYYDKAHWAGAGITAHIFQAGDAFAGGYVPTTSGDWSVVPADIGDALDDLAASRVSGSGVVGQLALWNGISSIDGYSTLTSDGSNLNIGTDILFAGDVDHSIIVDTATTDASGNNLTIKAADGYQAGVNRNNGGSLYFKAGAANDNVGEGGGPFGGSLFLDAGWGHNGSSLGNIFINQDGYTKNVYCGTNILMYSGTGPFNSSEFPPRTVGYDGLVADVYTNAPDLQFVGGKGGFAESFPGGNAGTGSTVYILGGAGGGGNNSGVGGLAGPGGDIYVTAGAGGTGGNTSIFANGGSVHLNGGAGNGDSGVDGYVYIGDSHMHGLSFFGVTPVSQPSSAGSTTVTSAGSGTAIKADTTSTGGIGSTAYTLSDIIKHLKELGLIAQ